eukprot:s1300_g3.t1
MTRCWDKAALLPEACDAEKLRLQLELRSGDRSDIHGLLWLYGLVFFSQFKPTEPFLVDFLVEDKGFSNHEVYQEIFPLFVYSRFPLLIVTGLASELPSVGGSDWE